MNSVFKRNNLFYRLTACKTSVCKHHYISLFCFEIEMIIVPFNDLSLKIYRTINPKKYAYPKNWILEKWFSFRITLFFLYELFAFAEAQVFLDFRHLSLFFS